MPIVCLIYAYFRPILCLFQAYFAPISGIFQAYSVPFFRPNLRIFQAFLVTHWAVFPSDWLLYAYLRPLLGLFEIISLIFRFYWIIGPSKFAHAHCDMALCSTVMCRPLLPRWQQRPKAMERSRRVRFRGQGFLCHCKTWKDPVLGWSADVTIASSHALPHDSVPARPVGKFQIYAEIILYWDGFGQILKILKSFIAIF